MSCQQQTDNARATGELYMVVPDGHVVMKCCQCPHMDTRHREHLTELPIRPRTDRWIGR